jgi:DNA-binding NtrC family response regulator
MVEADTLILAVDDNEDALYALERMLSHKGYRVVTANCGADALTVASEQVPSLILLDVMMPQLDGLAVTRRLKSDPILQYIPVILLTAKDKLEDIVEGLESGADGYITKPFRPEELLARTKAALRLRRIYETLQQSEESNERLQREVKQKYNFENIIGESVALQKVFTLAGKIAKSDSSVLIEGPSGTGKELFAKAIHFNSTRADKPFIAKNCAAFSETLLESQLFGHVKGAFTGATKDQKGLFSAADGGTLFLDEIGEMPLELQAKLLRVLQDGKFMPVGSTVEVSSDVRIIAATNRTLRTMAQSGEFREDLFYRLAVVTLSLPSLRERKEDIPLLVQHFLNESARKRDANIKEISEAALDKLKAHNWDGNIRELQNEVERMLILGVDDPILDVDLLSEHIAGLDGDTSSDVDASHGLKAALEELEQKLLLQTLKETDWNKSQAAKLLRISRSNLIAKVQHYSLEDLREK